MQSASKQFEAKATGLLNGQFHQTRLYLTLVYAVLLIAILSVSSLVTYSTFSNRIADRFEQLGQPIAWHELEEGDLPGAARDELMVSLLIVNGILVIGAVGLSYALAGYTLHPIQEGYERQRRFLSDASHELRTPLAILQTDLENELRDPRTATADQIRSHLEETQRMSAIANDLLLLSRLDSKENIAIPTEIVDVSAAITNTVQRLTEYARKQSVTLEVKSLPSTPITIAAHREHIMQAISNLIKNGIDYNKPDGQVTVSATKQKDHVIITVADTGIGIASSDIPRLFDRFYRADKSRVRTTGGSGLGLSIVQSIVRTYGGSISINSKPQQGTTITISFPYA